MKNALRIKNISNNCWFESNRQHSAEMPQMYKKDTYSKFKKRIKQNSTSLVKWFKSTKMKCLENVNMGVIRRCFSRRIGWRAHTAILLKRKLFKSFSYGSTPYTPTIPPIKKWVSGEIGTRNGNFYTHVFS